jgi:hypothetical protein
MFAEKGENRVQDRPGDTHFPRQRNRGRFSARRYPLWGSQGPHPWEMGGIGWGHRHRHWFFNTGLTGWQRAAACGRAFGSRWAEWMPFEDVEQEVTALRECADYYEDVIRHIRSRIDELEPAAENAPGSTTGKE